MTVLLSKAYAGYPVSQVVTLPTSTETALIAAGLATASTAASTTTGNVTANVPSGKVAFAAAATSVVITNTLIDASSKVYAAISQASADTTLTALRVVPAAGSVTIFANAAATATTLVDWAILPSEFATSGT